METNFSEWLTSEINNRQMTQADLARLSGITSAHISRLVNGMRKPGIDLCKAIARAFGMPPEAVFRAAGLLSSKPEKDEIIERIEHILENYKYPETKARALEYLEFLRTQEEKGTHADHPKTKRKESLSKALGG